MADLSPADAATAAEAVAEAAAAGTTLEVRGGGSKAAYGRPAEAQTVLDLSRLGGIRQYQPEELVMTAGAATPLAQVEAALAEAGQHLAFEPPDYRPMLGADTGGATIGGVLACNLSGPRRIVAGAARDHFLGVAAVSGRGEAFKSGGRVIKNVTGYDLSKLLAGSMGTLAVMTEVSLKVLPQPEDTRTVLIRGLDDGAAVAAMGDAAGSQREGSGFAHLPPAAAARSSVAAVSGAGGAVTALRLEGPVPSVAARAATLAADLAGRDLHELRREESLALWREIRDARLLPPDGLLWRISVPPASGAEVAGRIAAVGDCEVVFDWAGGLLWAAITGSDSGETVLAVVRGSLNGIGGHATLVRAPEEMRRRQPVFQPEDQALAALSARIKRAFDPVGILNPGRMVAGR